MIKSSEYTVTIEHGCKGMGFSDDVVVLRIDIGNDERLLDELSGKKFAVVCEAIKADGSKLFSYLIYPVE